MAWEDVLPIGHGAFLGRYHRDPAIAKAKADARYDQWMRELYDERRGSTAFSTTGGRPGSSARRTGCSSSTPWPRSCGARDWPRRSGRWSSWTCSTQGRADLHSSVSAGNLPIVNLYASLGFRFRNPLDVYHAWFPPEGGSARIE